MNTTAEKISECLTQLTEAHAMADTTIGELLTLLEDADAADRDSAALTLLVAEEIGRSGQAREGALIRTLAHADRVNANRAGLAPWINTHLDVTDGRARGLAQSAREIGHLPELAEPLSSGRIGAGTIRTLTRAARAVKGTDQDLRQTLAETLDTATDKGVGAANRQIRILEETIEPGRAADRLARQRTRTFLRVLECEEGMCRIEALLDDASATTVRAALDAHVSAALRARQYDGQKIPAGTESIEQLQAHALVRFAEVYLAATPEQRGAAFTAPTLYTTALDAKNDAGLAESGLPPRSRTRPWLVRLPGSGPGGSALVLRVG